MSAANFDELRAVKAKKVGDSQEYHGYGEVKCYGMMEVVAYGDDHGGNGTANCRPALGSIASPQGFIVDGDDGTHIVRRQRN